MIIDAHCDTLLEIESGRAQLVAPGGRGRVTLRRLRKGCIGIQFFAGFIESRYKPEKALERTLTLIEAFNRNILVDPHFSSVLSTGDLEKCREKKLIGALLAIEGGEAVSSPEILRILFRLGVRALGLTWNQRNQLADGCGEEDTGGGLSKLGKTIIREMNELGMIIDLAHIASRGYWDTLQTSSQPVIVSHACCQTLHDHPRNLNDEQLKALAAAGGVVGITFVPEFLGEGKGNMEGVIDHLVHVAQLVGPEFVGLGSDYDGNDTVPVGLEHPGKLAILPERLQARGFTPVEVKQIMGGNFLRVMKFVLPQ